MGPVHPFPYVLIYNGLESGGIDIGPLGATSNRELQNKYAQLLRTNYANPNLPVLQEIYKYELLNGSINSVLGVSKASVSHITLDEGELSYVLKESGTGFNLGVFLDAKWLTSTAFGLPDSDWNKATYTWYRDESIIASGKEHRVIDTSVYGAGNYTLDINFSPYARINNRNYSGIIGTRITVSELIKESPTDLVLSAIELMKILKYPQCCLVTIIDQESIDYHTYSCLWRWSYR